MVSLSDIKEILKLLFNLFNQAKREPGLGFRCQNGIYRPYRNFLDNIVPANQLCEIIQHINSVEKVNFEKKNLNTSLKQIKDISATL